MKKRVLLLFIFIISLSLNSQSSDTTNYVSTLEKEIFINVDSLSKTNNYFTYLFAIDSTANKELAEDKKREVDSFIAKFIRDKVSKFSKKKKIKFVFKAIHNKFLKKYEEVVNFSEIFKNGNYNCVSASAIYAYVFDALEIPYQIKETPSHIYLIAYPNDANIYIETTIPGNNGFYSPSDSDIKKAVTELVNGKLLTQKSVDKIGYKKAYMDFFYDKEYLKPIELVGVQYYNEGITHFQNEKYEEAYYSFKKSHQFYSTKKVKYLKISCLSLLIDKSNFNTTKDIAYVVTLLNSLEYEKDFLKKDLKYYTANIITANENNEKFLIEAINSIENGVKNTTVKNTITKELYQFVAETRYRKDKSLSKILEYALQAYELDKEDENVQNLISQTIIKSFFYVTPNKKSVLKIENYEKEFPFIKESNFYKKYMIRVYSYMTGQYYYKKQPDLGEEYFKKLKEFITIAKKDEIELDLELIGNAYWSIGSYHYAKSNLKAAKAILEEGKQISPEHHKLNKVLSYVTEDLE